VARDPEYDVTAEALVVIDEDLRDQRLVALLEAEEVQVGWPVRMPPLCAQKVAASTSTPSSGLP
jgi:hypothetical protein